MFDICNKLMKPTQKDNVLSLLKTSTSYRKIAAQRGVSKSKVAVLAKEAYPDKENLYHLLQNLLRPRITGAR